MFIHVYFLAENDIKPEETISSRTLCVAALELRCYSNLSLQIKQCQNGIYCFIAKKVTKHNAYYDLLDGRYTTMIRLWTENRLQTNWFLGFKNQYRFVKT